MKYKAFTLAEVLITLGVIGVIASITLPNLIFDYQKKITARKLQQAYNFLQQAQQAAIAEYGDMQNWECNSYGVCSEEQFVKKYILPYFSDPNIRTYRSLVSAGYKSYPKTMNGSTTLTGWRYFVRTKQGYYYMFSRYNVGDGSRSVFSVNIDINGVKGPNI